MKEMTAEEFDKLCDEGFQKLDELRADGKVRTPEYDKTFKKLQTITNERKKAVGLAPLK